MSAIQDDTSALEYWVTGGVILLFGLLYYLLNYGLPNSSAITSHLNTEGISAPSVATDAPDMLALKSVSLSPDSATTVKATAADNSAGNVTDEATEAAESAEPKPENLLAQQLQQQLTEASAQRQQGAEALKQADAARIKTEQEAALLAETARRLEAENQQLQQELEALKAQEANRQQAKLMQLAEAAETNNDQPLVYTLPNGQPVDIPAGGFEQRFEEAILEQQTGTPLLFDRVYFESGAATLNARSQAQIEATAALMNTYPEINVLIRGHTDDIGDINTNSLLSLTRSDNMKKALTELGINAERIRIEGFGPLDPIAPNNSEKNRQLNRRIELIILDEQAG